LVRCPRLPGRLAATVAEYRNEVIQDGVPSKHRRLEAILDHSSIGNRMFIRCFHELEIVQKLYKVKAQLPIVSARPARIYRESELPGKLYKSFAVAIYIYQARHNSLDRLPMFGGAGVPVCCHCRGELAAVPVVTRPESPIREKNTSHSDCHSNLGEV
jgi:hypothetical protein